MEKVLNSELEVLQESYINLLNLQKEIDERIKAMKVTIGEVVDVLPETTIYSTKLSVTRVKAFTSSVFDVKRFCEEHPDIAAQYQKEVSYNSYLIVRMRNQNNQNNPKITKRL